jgi:hypothetical protein
MAGGHHNILKGHSTKKVESHWPRVILGPQKLLEVSQHCVVVVCVVCLLQGIQLEQPVSVPEAALGTAISCQSSLRSD